MMNTRRILRMAVLCVLLWAGLGPAGLVTAQETIGTWSPPENISNTPGSSRFPRVATDAQGGLHVVWSENQDTDPGAWGNAIYYTRQQNGEWSAPIDIVYNGRGVAHLPAIAVDDDSYVHLIWTDQSHLYYQHAPVSTAHTAQGWSARQIISWDGWEAAYWSDMIIVGDTIYVVWSGSREGLWDINFTRSTNKGQTWTDPIKVTDTFDAMETRPHLGLGHDGTIHLVWSENKASDAGIGIRYSRSSDTGQSWDPPFNVADVAGVAGAAVIAVDPKGPVHIAWQQGWGTTDTRNFGIWHRVSTDGGNTWAPSTRVDDGYGGTVPLSLALDSSGRLSLVWQQQVGYPRVDLFYARWENRAWFPRELLAPDQGDARPQIAVTEGNVLNVVWANDELFYTRAVTDAPRVVPVALVASPTAAPTALPKTAPWATSTVSPTPLAATFPTDPPGADVSRPGWNPFLVSLGSVSALLLVTLVLVRRNSARGGR